ncbi:MAG: NifB/NifX family molybdenum-iron cluster-binding protein [Mailhella sp.]|nr:NifB/NifX family molybdenum-iron cluster-binding protein [Mailhella sp.]
MTDPILVAVPSNAPGGLDAAPSAHFGHCDAYTVALVSDGKIQDARVEPNKGHEHGGCVAPVRELAGMGVKALIAGGMGMNPLTAMREMGLTVYYATGYATVRDALQAFIEGKLPEFGTNELCRGACGHHHG